MAAPPPRFPIIGRGRAPAGAPKPPGIAAAVQVGRRGKQTVNARVGTKTATRAGAPGAETKPAPVPGPPETDAVVVIGTGEKPGQVVRLLLFLPTLTPQKTRAANREVRRRVDKVAIRAREPRAASLQVTRPLGRQPTPVAAAAAAKVPVPGTCGCSRPLREAVGPETKGEVTEKPRRHIMARYLAGTALGEPPAPKAPAAAYASGTPPAHTRAGRARKTFTPVVAVDRLVYVVDERVRPMEVDVR